MGEVAQYYTTGCKRDLRDRRDYRVAGILAPVEIPKQKFIIDDPFDIKNQDGRGSCTGQAQAHHKERQERVKLSARFIMALSKKMEGNTGYGGYTRNTFKVAKDTGVCEESMHPEPNVMTWEEYIAIDKIPNDAYDNATKHKSESFWRVNNDIDEIRNVLITYKNSINMSMAWHKEFNRPLDDGTLPSYSTVKEEGHAVDIIGFDDIEEKLIVKNSWGKGWGKDGYFKLLYSMFPSVVWDLWCSLDLPEDLPVDNYYGGKRTWTGYLREKACGLNPWLLGKIGRLPTRREIIGLAYGFHDWTSVFRGYNGDAWLHKTKPQLIQEGFNYKV